MKLRGDGPLSFSGLQFVRPPVILQSEKNWRWTTTISRYYNLWCILRGQGVITIDRQPFPLHVGQVFVLAPGQQVDAYHDEENPIHNTAAHFRVLNANGRTVPAREFPLAGMTIRNISFFEQVMRNICRLWSTRNARCRQTAEIQLLGLLGQVVADRDLPPTNPMDIKIQNLAEQINANPGRQVTVDTLAREASLSRVQFTRRFKRLMGEAPGHYLIRKRIERAEYLIEESDLQIGEIAEMLGYTDLFYFSRQFKSLKGFPPSQLRKQRLSVTDTASS